ncbi:glycoprotease [Spiroplasma litorale]|uniref:Glycoprotease n=1 Tax=Spiroplasma litorale TaxID=216942 RepID=A0A0K1W2I4_9MOLU|nr:tRNA (adenosine(37)-N6)-threonylcarbamoyltransferase complex dimerization subunit type 1 TsaB [Spiroplasma litorale]AKX34544.1 glycoprotease [Spiroplasma litorale]
MNLFIDTTNNRLILIIEKNNQIIDYLDMKNQLRISDILIEEIDKMFKKNNIKINEVNSFYVVNGPGSYTGVRLGVTFSKTIKTINNDVNVYLISSLAFQAGDKKCISMIDARGDKYYIGVYDNKKNIIVDQVLNKEDIDQFKSNFKNYEILVDYNEIDIINNFLILKNDFKIAKSVNEINPLYIKHFI